MRIWGPPQGVEVNEGAPPGRPEVTPPPAGDGEVKVTAKLAEAEVKTAATKGEEVKAAQAASAEVTIVASGEEKVKVTSAELDEVKVAPKVATPTVLAPAKTDSK